MIKGEDMYINLISTVGAGVTSRRALLAFPCLKKIEWHRLESFDGLVTGPSARRSDGKRERTPRPRWVFDVVAVVEGVAVVVLRCLTRFCSSPFAVRHQFSSQTLR